MTRRGRSRRALGALATGLALLSGADAVAAQEVCGGGGKYHVEAAPHTLAHGPVSFQELEGGYFMGGAIAISIRPRGKPNEDWRLCVRGTSPGAGVAAKDVADFEWRLAGDAGWHPASNTEQMVTLGSGQTDVEVLFRVAVGWDDAPGNYLGLFTFAVSRQ